MAGSDASRSLKVQAGVIDTGVTITRRVIPVDGQPTFGAFRRVTESVANRGRQLPDHAHEGEEVLTLVTEGTAIYQLAGAEAEQIPTGAARLLIAPQRIVHRVSPGTGVSIRWINLVVALPKGAAGATELRGATPRSALAVEDEVHVRRLVGSGPPASMVSTCGLTVDLFKFGPESTTFRRIGVDRTGLVYVISGRGTVDQRPIEAGEAAFIEGFPGVALEGSSGFSAVLATALRPTG